MQKNKVLSAVYVLLAAVLWGTMGIFVRALGAEGLSTFEILQTRVLGGCLFTGVFLLLFHKDAFSIHLRDLWCLLGTGVGSLFLMSYCYYQGIAASSMAIMAALLYTAPAFVMLLSRVFFGEKLTGAKIAAILLTVLGCVLVSGAGTEMAVSLKILLYGLGSGFSYSLYSIFGRFAMQRKYSSWTVTFYTLLICAVFCAFFCNWQGLWQTLSQQPQLIGWAAANGLVTAFAAYGLYTLGLSGLPTGTASVMASLEPVAAAVFGAVIFGETVSVFQLLGIALVLGGIAVVAVFTKA